MKFYDNPEIIASVRIVDQNGNDKHVGDLILAAKTKKDNEYSSDGTVEFDLRNAIDGKKSVMFKVDLADLMQQLTSSVLNAEQA